MKSNILDIAISSGLNMVIPKLTNYKDIPSDCFGVFVTLKRSVTQTVTSWPHNIHGCIGYWNKDFKQMTKKQIVERIVES